MTHLSSNHNSAGPLKNNPHGRLRGHSRGFWADGSRDFVLSAGILLHLSFVVAEGAAGFEGYSAALLADAGRNLGSGLCLGLAGWYGRPARGSSRGHYPYGFNRLPLQASVFTAMGLCVLLGFLLLATVDCLRNPQPVNSPLVGLLAGAGLLLHTATAGLLVRGAQPEVGGRSEHWYLFTDAFLSLGMGMGAALVYFTGWQWVDAVLALSLLGFIGYTIWTLLAPGRLLRPQALDINEDEVWAFLLGQPGVREVQQLRIWALNPVDTALSVQLVRPCGDDNAFIEYLQEALQQEFNIRQVTVQFDHETSDSGT